MNNLEEFAENLESFYVYTIIVPQLEDNLSINQLNILNEILLPNDHVAIEVVIQNNGITDKENILIQLSDYD